MFYARFKSGFRCLFQGDATVQDVASVVHNEGAMTSFTRLDVVSERSPKAFRLDQITAIDTSDVA